MAKRKKKIAYKRVDRGGFHCETENILASVKAKHLLMLAPFVCWEETRYYLNGIFIQRAPQGGIYLAATDGHRLGIIYDPDGETNAEVIFRLPPETLRRIRENKPLGAVLTQSGCSLVANAGDVPEGPYPGGPIEGTFPAFWRVIPHVRRTSKPAAFNARYVGDFRKVGVAAGLPNDGACGHANLWQFYPAESKLPESCAFIVRNWHLPEFLGVLMPARGEKGFPARPDWLFEDGEGAA
ncbi:DNA polymerase III subunit beta [Methyloligella halotolerans]|uniref:DNA polymerase III subunit beta n=1 Tax=Methyloligella halotolerans TaxID=1177755 RepID=A0A1E2RZY4_9HYPH|nr:hypothetical protein [Methyloligella halotolerans]ODA67648.1 DNA polymerase III subunit beta [Methyloligella halotolerans]